MLRLLEEIDDFRELELGLVDAGDLLEINTSVRLKLDLGLRLAHVQFHA